MAAVNNRYARAFVDAILDMRLDVTEVQRQLRALMDVLGESSDLRRIWDSPAIPAQQKRTLLDAVAARGNFLKPLRNFAAVLIDHRRIGGLSQIAEQIQIEIDRRLGLAEAEVTSARELHPEEREALEAQVERLTGKRVRAEYATDVSLLGGAVVRLGSTIYDGSVRGQLRRMKEQLAAE